MRFQSGRVLQVPDEADGDRLTLAVVVEMCSEHQEKKIKQNLHHPRGRKLTTAEMQTITRFNWNMQFQKVKGTNDFRFFKKTKSHLEFYNLPNLRTEIIQIKAIFRNTNLKNNHYLEFFFLRKPREEDSFHESQDPCVFYERDYLDCKEVNISLNPHGIEGTLVGYCLQKSTQKKN